MDLWHWTKVSGLALAAVLVVAGCNMEDPDEMPPPTEEETATPVVVATPDGDTADDPETSESGRKPIHETYVHAPTQFVPGAKAGMRILVAQADGIAHVEPVAAAKVEVLLKRDKKLIARVMDARTDRYGTLTRSVRFPDVEEGSYDLVVRTSSKYGKDEVVSPVTVSKHTRVLLLTDKPIYQPTQTIHLRALALSAFDRTPASGSPVELVIEDAKGNRVFKRSMKAGEFGDVHTDFQLAHEVNEGPWRITATIGDVEASKTVTVKKYVLPKFKVAIDAGGDYFKPGETIKGTVDASYFFGKPVAGGRVTLIASKFDVAFNEFTRVTGKTDEDGIFEFEMELPAAFQGQPLANGDALLRLEATVYDKAEQKHTVSQTWPVAANGYRVTLIPESGKLIPGVKNQVWAISTRPSGEPLANTKVTLKVGDDEIEAQTDEAGIASLELTATDDILVSNPQWKGNAWSYEQYLPVTLSAVAPDGEKLRRSENLSTEAAGPAILLRADKALYEAGDTAHFEVLTSHTGGLVYLDVVKQGQTVATRTVRIRKGRGKYHMPLSSDFTGTLELHAYVIPMDGNIVRDTKVVYVEPSSDLKISAKPDKKVYRPGEEAVIRFQVSDAAGRGVPAALATVIVDESVYALQEIQPGLEKVYFTLEKELQTPRVELHFNENNVADLIRKPDREVEARRDRAAQILLASTTDLYSYAWTVNPAADRVKSVQNFYWQVAGGLQYLVQNERNTMGTRDKRTGTWKWAKDPVPMIRKRGWNVQVPKDPWGKDVTIQDLAELGYPVSFDEVAAQATAGRLQTVYYALMNYAQRHPKEVADNRNIWQANLWTFPGDVMKRLGDEQLLAEVYRKDAWGQPLRIEVSRKDQPNRQGIYYNQLRRMVVVSAGPDGRFGTEDDIDQPVLTQHAFWANKLADGIELEGNIGIVGGVGGLGMRGVGRGGGGRFFARGAKMAARQVPAAAMPVQDDFRADALKSGEVAMPVGSASGKGDKDAGGGSAPVKRVREFFPETLLWNPSLLTDGQGHATLRVPVADSITTWRMTCSANTKGGQLGGCESSFKVFQDFFVDLNLPVALTRGDEVSIPVAVYNYLETGQEVRLELEKADWFELVGESTKTLQVDAGDVDVRFFRIRALDVGKKKLEVAAYGPKMSDAVRRDIEIVPDGKAMELTASNQIGNGAKWSFDIPEGVIPGANQAFVKFYPGTFSQVVEGLDSILRMPGGCMEQTGSSAYPNTLVMDYLIRSKQNTPQIQMKAEEYVNLGYQRMLTFQTPSGGFALWGAHDTPKVFLTAWGLQILQDTAKVHTVDERVLARARSWLAQQQKADGSFPTTTGVHQELWGRFKGDFGMTAYVAWSLAEGDSGGAMQKKALGYLEKNWKQIDDSYLLAMAGAAFAAAKPKAKVTHDLLDELARRRVSEDDKIFWKTGTTTFYAQGATANIETTALAAYALHRGGRHHNVVKKALSYLVGAKDANGTWFSTQGTILSLKALLAASDPSGSSGDDALVKVLLNDEKVSTVRITPENSDVMQVVDLRPWLKPGKNRVQLKVQGESNTTYQTVARYYVPWKSAPRLERPEPFNLSLKYDRTGLDVDDTVTAQVRLELLEKRRADNVMLDLGIPPGFDPDMEAFEKLKQKGIIAKYSTTGRQIIIYLDHLEPNMPLRFDYDLTAKFPIRARTPKSTAYKYYSPNEKTESAPQRFVVRQRDS